MGVGMLKGMGSFGFVGFVGTESFGFVGFVGTESWDFVSAAAARRRRGFRVPDGGDEVEGEEAGMVGCFADLLMALFLLLRA